VVGTRRVSLDDAHGRRKESGYVRERARGRTDG
jgi:hypothetical protein